jgi:hypothetical protein
MHVGRQTEDLPGARTIPHFQVDPPLLPAAAPLPLVRRT